MPHRKQANRQNPESIYRSRAAQTNVFVGPTTGTTWNPEAILIQPKLAWGFTGIWMVSESVEGHSSIQGKKRVAKLRSVFRACITLSSTTGTEKTLLLTEFSA